MSYRQKINDQLQLSCRENQQIKLSRNNPKLFMSTFTVRIRAVMVIYSQIAKENSYIKRVDFYLAFSSLKQRDFVRTKFKITDVTQSVFSS